jgi:predicted PurR-regulated permease PerM
MSEREEPTVAWILVDPKTLALAVLAVIALILLLHYARAVLIPIVVAVLLSYVLGPAVTSMARLGIPRFIGSAIALAFLSGALGLGVYTLADEAMEIVESVPEAASGLRDRVRSQRRQREGALQKVQRAATEIERAATEIEQSPRPAAAAGGVQRVQIVEPTFSARDYLWYGSMGLIGFAGQFVMVMFLVYFLLVAGDLYKRKLVKIAGPTLTKKRVTVEIMDEINLQISHFLRVQVFTGAIVAVMTAAALWWLGVQHPVMWGLIAGVLNTIPYLGPVVVTAALGVVTIMQFDDPVRAAYVCGTTLAITSLEGWLITPALMSRASRMNPVAIFVGLLFWTWLWGIWGTILAVPMLMMLKAICDRVEDLQPVGELLGE